MKRTILSIICMALAICVFTSCNPAAAPTGDATPAPSPTPADEDVIICKIGDDTLYRNEFAALFLPYYNYYLSNGIDFSNEENLTMLQNSIFDSMVRATVIQQQAAIHSIVLTDTEKQAVQEAADEDYQYFLNSYISTAEQQGSANPAEDGEKSFLAMLKQDGYDSAEQYRAQLYGEQTKIMLADKLKQQVISSFVFDEEATKKQYEEDVKAEEERYTASPSLFEGAQNAYDQQGGVPPLFTPDGYIRVKHILVDSEELALDLISRAQAGEDFDALMAQYGTDPGMKQSPAKEIGYLVGPDTSFVAEFKTAAFALGNVGDLSEPVQSTHGYHVIKLVKKLESKALDWEAVKDSYKSTAENSYFQDQMATWMKETEITSYIGRIRDLGKPE